MLQKLPELEAEKQQNPALAAAFVPVVVGGTVDFAVAGEGGVATVVGDGVFDVPDRVEVDEDVATVVEPMSPNLTLLKVTLDLLLLELSSVPQGPLTLPAPVPSMPSSHSMLEVASFQIDITRTWPRAMDFWMEDIAPRAPKMLPGKAAFSAVQ